MSRFVLDPSIALAWCFDGESNPLADRILEFLRSGEAVVTAHWPLEFGNALLVGERRGRITIAEIASSLALIRGLPIHVAESLPVSAIENVMALAREQRLSVYDAAYLDLAMRHGIPIASLDVRLNQAAGTVGVERLL